MPRTHLLRSLACSLALGLAGCSADLVGPYDAGAWDVAPGPVAVAPPPPAAPSRATGARISPEEHNLRGLNAYRASLGLGTLTLDPQLSTFALEGSRAQMRERRPHGNFQRAARSGALFRVHGFKGRSAENQGDCDGWPPMGGLEAQIDDCLAAMWREGPGGGHYDAMVNPRFRRVGIGLIVTTDGSMWLTNDFSE
jgi:hypothetical protein